MNTLMTDALTQLRREECAIGMEQSVNYAAVKEDVQTWLAKEEFASGMEQSAAYAASREGCMNMAAKAKGGDCALDIDIDTGQRSKDVTVKDAQTML